MKALSVKQPWAHLICTPREDNPLLGIKDIENRTWRTNFRGKIYIHASAPKKFNVNLTDEQMIKALPTINDAIEGKISFGAIIGEVEIIDCVINHSSIWAEKTPINHFPIPKGKKVFNWVLANPVLYDNPIINVKGALSFWEPSIIIQECIGCSEKFNYEEMEEDDGGERFCHECWKELSPLMMQEAKENENI
jgi:hypothetical protein